MMEEFERLESRGTEQGKGTDEQDQGPGPGPGQGQDLALVTFDLAWGGGAHYSVKERLFDFGRLGGAKKAPSIVRIKQSWSEKEGHLDDGEGSGFGLGAIVYAAEVVLAFYLADQREAFVRGKRVLELGCGLGMAGIACACPGFGAREVVLSDGDATLLELTAENVELNGVGKVARTAGWSEGTGRSAARLLLSGSLVLICPALCWRLRRAALLCSALLCSALLCAALLSITQLKLNVT